jgi:hypothetical protein
MAQAAITTREATLDPDGRFEVRLQPGLRTWLALHGSIAGTQTTIDTELSLQAGDNDWTLELWTARIEGHVYTPGPLEGRHTQPQQQVELGDVRIRAVLQVDEQGRLEPVSVAAGRGVLRGPQREMREPGPIWAEIDLAPGETRVLDLR